MLSLDKLNELCELRNKNHYLVQMCDDFLEKRNKYDILHETVRAKQLEIKQRIEELEKEAIET